MKKFFLGFVTALAFLGVLSAENAVAKFVAFKTPLC